MLAFLAPFQGILVKIAIVLALLAGAWGHGFMTGTSRMERAVEQAQSQALRDAIEVGNAKGNRAILDAIAAEGKRQGTAKLMRELSSKVDKSIAANKAYVDPKCDLIKPDVELWNELNQGKKGEVKP